MRTRIVLCWTAASALSLICHISTGQTTTVPTEDRLDRLEQRLTELEADVKSRDEEDRAAEVPAQSSEEARDDSTTRSCTRS